MTQERVAALVARWVRFYTRDVPAAIARRRIEEIDADLHDYIAHERTGGARDRRVGADVSWRDQHTKAVTDRPTSPGGPLKTHDIIPPASSPQRPLSVTILAIPAAVGGVGAVLGVLAGAFLIHGLASLDATDAIIVLPALGLATLYLAFAYGAWTLKSGLAAGHRGRRRLRRVHIRSSFGSGPNSCAMPHRSRCSAC